MILNLLFHQKFRNCGVLKCKFQQSQNKIDSPLESDYHSWHQIPSNAQIPDAGTVDTFHPFGVSPDIVGIKPQKVPQPVREEEGENVVLHHRFHTALHQADLFKAFQYDRSEEHTFELQSRGHLVCRLLLEKKNSSIEIDMRR